MYVRKWSSSMTRKCSPHWSYFGKTTIWCVIHLQEKGATDFGTELCDTGGKSTKDNSMETYRGTKSLQPFSPNWADPEILEKTLIGRKPLVDRLEELVLDGAGGANKHQRLIVGVRGSGKTHVLKVLHNRLWLDKSLKNRLLIIYLLPMPSVMVRYISLM